MLQKLREKLAKDAKEKKDRERNEKEKRKSQEKLQRRQGDSSVSHFFGSQREQTLEAEIRQTDGTVSRFFRRDTVSRLGAPEGTTSPYVQRRARQPASQGERQQEAMFVPTFFVPELGELQKDNTVSHSVPQKSQSEVQKVNEDTTVSRFFPPQRDVQLGHRQEDTTMGHIFTPSIQSQQNSIVSSLFETRPLHTTLSGINSQPHLLSQPANQPAFQQSHVDATVSHFWQPQHESQTTQRRPLIMETPEQYEERRQAENHPLFHLRQRGEDNTQSQQRPRMIMETPAQYEERRRPTAPTYNLYGNATFIQPGTETPDERMQRIQKEAAEQAARVTAAICSYYDLPQTAQQQIGTVSSSMYNFGRPRPATEIVSVTSAEAEPNTSQQLRLSQHTTVTEESDEERKKRLERERVQKYRAKLNEEQKRNVREANTAFQQLKRSQESPEETERRRQTNANLQLARRQQETAAETERRRRDDAASHLSRRQQETAAQTERRRQDDAASHLSRRQQETAAQTERRRQADAASHRNRVERALNIRRNNLQQLAQHGSTDFDETFVATHSCGPMNIVCQFCNSRNFAKERPSDKMFNNCCHKGKVKLIKPLDDRGNPQQYPAFLQSLMTDPLNPHYKNFRQNIRSYNSSLSFASMGAKIVQAPGRGPYVFKVNGTIYHKTSHLNPSDGQTEKYAQLYILDSTQAVDTRMELPENQRLHAAVVDQIDRFLRVNNRLAESYRLMRQVQDEEARKALNENRAIPIVSMAIRSDRESDARRYNLPTSNEIAMVFVDEDGEPPFNRDIRVYPRNPRNPNYQYIHIPITDANLDPMTYTILFPYGEPGWHDKLISTGYQNADRSRQNKHVTILQFKSALMAIRDEFNPIIHSGNLFQQWAVDSYLQSEANNLHFARKNQSRLRADLYAGLADYVANRAAAAGVVAGVPVILPSSFEGSPRNMRQRLHDAMAIFARYGSVDAFITFTANPKWDEVTSNLAPGETASDRADLVARVFALKLEALMEDITVNRILGRTVAWVYTIEFQKRGLPHAHILVVFAEDDKFRTAERIDEIVCAELPDPNRNPRLYAIVTRCMLHGPCGAFNPNAPCMENENCSKDFPKKFSEETETCTSGYPNYRRRIGPTFQKGRHTFDNRHVVPYNKFLTVKYDAHINVEVCTSMRSVKYIYKYIYKGFDCAKVSIGVDGQTIHTHDEISNYIDGRYVSAPEAVWRLFKNVMHDRSHAIYQLPVHLPRQQYIQFEEGNEEEALDQARSGQTKLTAWFELNQRDPAARSLLYTDIPNCYTFAKSVWQTRKQGTVISRMYIVGANDEERFCLRLLLLHVRGATSYEDLRTVDGVLYDTFKQAAFHRNLLSSDEEWDKTLREAAIYQMPSQMRRTFAYICIYCSPTNALILWMDYWNDMTLDFRHNYDDDTSKNLALHDIESVLNQHNRTCSSFGLPTPVGTVAQTLDFDRLEEESIAERLMPTLNNEQRDAFDQIVAAIDNASSQKLFFLNGPGGTGKTYLYNTLMSFIRGRGQTVLAFATTGIAATLMKNGTTVHSGFGLPVPILDNSTSKIRTNTAAANEIRTAALLIIDECTMLDKDALRVIDLLLQGIMNNKLPFGGKVLVIGGDFRQTLPIVKGGKKVDIIQRCLKSSRLWRLFKELTLISNQRSRLQDEYNEWLLDIGVANTAAVAGLSENAVEIPSHMITQDDIVNVTFTESVKNLSIDELSRRVILATTNKDTLEINATIIDKLDGELKTYYSSDSIISADPNDVTNYPLEFIHQQTPSGVPPHRLCLKLGAIVMLIRNLNRRKGLCNGTRMIVRGLHEMFISCEIISESHKGDIVFLSRIDITPSDTTLPFQMKRRQFPVIPAFAITINKSQGQTYDIVTLYLNEPVFGHGQLYVALSRSRNPANVKVYIKEGRKQGRMLNDDRWFTENIVYQEIFL